MIERWKWLKAFIFNLNQVNLVFGFPTVEVSFAMRLISRDVKKNIQEWMSLDDSEMLKCNLNTYISISSLGIMVLELCDDKAYYMLSKEKQLLYYNAIRGKITLTYVEEALYHTYTKG